MSVLSDRLKVIASFVPKGKSVCDVGTDHGYLPAALCLSGDFKSVTATDIREKPLKKAAENLARFGANDVGLILCNGLSAVPYEKAETVIIAGMGGDVISGIIDRCPYKEKSLFILQPMSAAPVLREYLASNGFEIKKETAVIDNKRIYPVMCCRFDGKKRVITSLQKRIGAIKPDTKANSDYIKRQLKIVDKCIEDLEKANINSDFLQENLNVREELIKVLEG